MTSVHLARVVDVLELCQEHCLLHHAEEDDSSNPELQSEDLPPVEGADHQPGEAQQDVDPAHDGVEGEEGIVRDGEISVRRGGLHLKVNAGLVGVEGDAGRADMDDEKIDSILRNDVDRLVVVGSVSLLTRISRL